MKLSDLTEDENLSKDDLEREILDVKKSLRKKLLAASSDQLLKKAIQQVMKQHKLKIEDLPNMKRYIDANIDQDPATQWLKNNFK